MLSEKLKELLKSEDPNILDKLAELLKESPDEIKKLQGSIGGTQSKLDQRTDLTSNVILGFFKFTNDVEVNKKMSNAISEAFTLLSTCVEVLRQQYEGVEPSSGPVVAGSFPDRMLKSLIMFMASMTKITGKETQHPLLEDFDLKYSPQMIVHSSVSYIISFFHSELANDDERMNDVTVMMVLNIIEAKTAKCLKDLGEL